MANVLPFAVRVRAIALLVEGMSIRATARQCSVDKDAVMRLGAIVGLGCLVLHDRIVRGVAMAIGEVDEIWTYVGRHERRKRSTDPTAWGDAYTMFAIDAVTKVVPAFLTGRRDIDTAAAFMHDLRSRVVGKPQLSVDGWPPWPEAVRRAFGRDGCDLGLVVKEYQRENPARTHNPGRVKQADKRSLYGAPDMGTTSTSIAERLNMTTRMGQRRLTRLTNAYSKKVENLRAAVALHFAHYNLVRHHETIGTTPAARAGLAHGPWSLAQLVREAIAVSPASSPVDLVADAGDIDDAPVTLRNPSPWCWSEPLAASPASSPVDLVADAGDIDPDDMGSNRAAALAVLHAQTLWRDSERAVVTALIERADAAGAIAGISHEQVGRDAGVGKLTAQRALNILERAGIVTRTTSGRRGSDYALHVDALAGWTGQPRPAWHRCDRESRPR